LCEVHDKPLCTPEHPLAGRGDCLDIYTATIAVSILVYIIVGNYAGRGVKGLDDYYVAGRRAPTLLIPGTLVASVMSSTMFPGEAILALSWFVVYVSPGLFAARVIRGSYSPVSSHNTG